jgi:hypothetical protein
MKKLANFIFIRSMRIQTYTRRFLVFILLFSAIAAKAQGDMRFFGTAMKDGKPLSGATVTVLMDGKQILNLTTGKNGKFKFTVDIGHSYRINFSAPGCVDMYMMMDLHTPPDKTWIYPDYVTEIPFFSSNDPKVKTELFAQKPFIKVIYDGDKGFYDDPKYRFVEEIFKDPMEEQRRQEQARKDAEDKARREAEDKARRDEEERLRKAREEEDRRRQQETQNPENPAVTPGTQPAQTSDPSMETEAIRLEREKQDRLTREKQNKSIKAQYENNLLKLVAESERRNNLQKYNKMKEDAQGNSVIEVMRREAARKAQQDFLIQQQKEKEKQTLANKQVKEQRLRMLVITAAQVERDYKKNHLRPVALAMPLNYSPSPNVVVTFRDGVFSSLRSTVISWPGGKRTIFREKEFWWGKRYYYLDNAEIDAKTFNAELYKLKRS